MRAVLDGDGVAEVRAEAAREAGADAEPSRSFGIDVDIASANDAACCRSGDAPPDIIRGDRC